MPNAPSPDTVNYFEGVRVGVPAPGEYIVRVRASHVADDGRSDTPAVGQDLPWSSRPTSLRPVRVVACG